MPSYIPVLEDKYNVNNNLDELGYNKSVQMSPSQVRRQQQHHVTFKTSQRNTPTPTPQDGGKKSQSYCMIVGEQSSASNSPVPFTKKTTQTWSSSSGGYFSTTSSRSSGPMETTYRSGPLPDIPAMTITSLPDNSDFGPAKTTTTTHIEALPGGGEAITTITTSEQEMVSEPFIISPPPPPVQTEVEQPSEKMEPEPMSMAQHLREEFIHSRTTSTEGEFEALVKEQEEEKRIKKLERDTQRVVGNFSKLQTFFIHESRDGRS